MLIKRGFAFRPRTLLTGIILGISVIILGAVFMTSIGREARGETFIPQAPHPLATTAPADQGEAIFTQKCSSCHTVGEGRTVGPDLKGVTDRRDRDWLISFIVSPDQLIAQGDPIASQLVQEYNMAMPNMGVSEQEAEEILAYIEAKSGSQPTSLPQAQDEEKKAVVTVGDAATGKDIFTGKTRLRNGGAACISCHNTSGIGALGGGTIGKDLTQASALGEQGLTSILKTMPFPLMKATYTNQPLTDEEIANLVAFLQETGSGQQEKPSRTTFIFIVISLVGCLIIVGIFQLIWRGRLSGVRQPLVKGGSK